MYKVLISNYLDKNESIINNLSEKIKQECQECEIKQSKGIENFHKKLDCLIFIFSDNLLNVYADLESVLELIIELHRLHSENKPVVYFIYYQNSFPSVPINHPITKYLENIEHKILAENKIDSLSKTIVSKIKSERKLDKNLIINTLKYLSTIGESRNWLFAYVGEDQLGKIQDLTQNLRNEKKIQSLFSYWGVAPVRMWINACQDPFYHMKHNIVQFPKIAKNAFEKGKITKEMLSKDYNFVSLGVGNGDKDKSIIEDFFLEYENNRSREDFLYLPVDFSLNMLDTAVKNVGDVRRVLHHFPLGIQKKY